MLDIPLWVWLVTSAWIVGMIVFDFFAHVKTPHAPTFRESAIWSSVYIGIAVLFGIGFLLVVGPEHGGEFFAGYLTEKSLSVDNLFVFLLIMTSFKVPREDQQKVLLWGVAIALVLRTIFILLGAAALEQWSWIFYIFGAFLLWTAWKQAQPQDHSDDTVPGGKLLERVKRVIPTVDEYHGDRLTVKIDGKRFMTPMLIVMFAIGITDVVFAFDSIPAIYGLTQEPYIVFTANAFALLGLRQLYFLIGGLLERLVYLHIGLAVILAFIGVKLVLHAMHVNELSFINGGEHIDWAPEIPISVSLLVILGTLVVVTAASLWKTRRDSALATPVPEGASDEVGPAEPEDATDPLAPVDRTDRPQGPTAP